jgi:hypothetical protein
MVWGLADGTAIVNPGSPTLPYGYRGLIGTVGFIEVDSGLFQVSVVDLATGKPQLHLTGPAAHPCTRGPRPAGGRLTRRLRQGISQICYSTATNVADR